VADVSNILFDFGNIIIDIDIPGAIERIGSLKRNDVSEQDYDSHIRDLVRKYEVDAISTDLFINGILKLSDVKVQARDVIDAWNSMLVGIPAYRLTMLQQLRGKFGLFMLSNTNYMHIEWVHAHLKRDHDIHDFETRYFDEVYYSHLIKARKPDHGSFRLVAREAMITPSKTLFIDDNEENIAAADLLGFQTLLSPPEKDVAEDLKLMGLF